ncbi:MAG: hypothetical protein J5965_05540 [Aeriscardovia sp.]|nr:hypothetical protein [Aeriscardovia sp.]
MYNIFSWIGLSYKKNPYIDSALVYQLDDDFNLELGIKLPTGACLKKYRRCVSSSHYRDFYSVNCMYKKNIYSIGYKKLSHEIIWIAITESGFKLKKELFIGLDEKNINSSYFSSIEKPKNQTSLFKYKIAQTIFDGWKCVLVENEDSYSVFQFFKTSLEEYDGEYWKMHPHITKIYGISMYLPWFLFLPAFVSLILMCVTSVIEWKFIQRVKIVAFSVYALFLVSSCCYIGTNEVLFGYL